MSQELMSEKRESSTASLPPWQVILHNDEVNTGEYVVQSLQRILRFEETQAVDAVLTAHKNGRAFLITTHQEKAELVVEQFRACSIEVTAEKA